MQAAASFWREKCTRAHAQRFAMDRFPLLEWLPKYTMNKFVKDLQAGLVEREGGMEREQSLY